MLVVVLVSGSVVVIGSLFFVGLLVFYVVKLVVCKENYWIFILSSLFGFVFVFSVDIVVWVILLSGEILIGIFLFGRIICVIIFVLSIKMELNKLFKIKV